MQTEIFIAGFGGQGVLFAGQLLAYAAMDEGREVTWIPSYGPEMRGGTANCTVIISDEEIGSPLVRHPQAFIVMNLPSLGKYEGMVRPGGVAVIDSSIVNRKAARDDIQSILIPGNQIAEELGDRRMTNMVLIGGLLACLPVLPVDAVGRALEAHLPARHLRLLPMNLQALRRGAEVAALQIR
jgi:2-oxoglutarate ferredoxin oxidoreductase subunit gamma